MSDSHDDDSYGADYMAPAEAPMTETDLIAEAERFMPRYVCDSFSTASWTGACDTCREGRAWHTVKAFLASLQDRTRERDEAITALADCHRESGADPDGNEDWRLAREAVRAVKELRADKDSDLAAAQQEIARLTADLDQRTRHVEMLQDSAKALARNANELNVALNTEQDARAALVEEVARLTAALVKEKCDKCGRLVPRQYIAIEVQDGYPIDDPAGFMWCIVCHDQRVVRELKEAQAALVAQIRALPRFNHVEDGHFVERTHAVWVSTFDIDRVLSTAETKEPTI